MFETAGDIIIECLNNLTEKSESDMIKLTDFLEVAKVELKGYKNIDHLNFYINRIFENFRKSDKEGKTAGKICESKKYK